MSSILNRTHTTCGAAAGAWLGVAVAPSPAMALVGTAVAALAAFMPDLDHLDASPVRAWELFRWRCRGLRIFRWTPIPKFTFRVGIGPLVSWILRAISKATTGRAHRGWTHSLLFALILGVGAGLLLCLNWLPILESIYLGGAVTVGVVAALLGDLVTNSGLKHFLWPFKTVVSVPHCLRIGTGGIVELYVVFPAMLVATWAGLALLILGG